MQISKNIILKSVAEIMIGSKLQPSISLSQNFLLLIGLIKSAGTNLDPFPSEF
jgi:hypothetical protein